MTKFLRTIYILTGLLAVLLIGLSLESVMANQDESLSGVDQALAGEPSSVVIQLTATPRFTAQPTSTPFMPQTATSVPFTATATTVPPTPTPTHPPAEAWKSWPVLPQYVSDDLRQVYRRGLAAGNDPNAFSILGDCQSEPDEFLGIFDRDPAVVASLNPELRETVNHFRGSFDRYSPTVKSGTTEGALLFALWNDNREGKCLAGEIPIDCELRVHKPVIAFIHVGTHWETRNEHYLTILIEKLLENGTVPVLVTKADNREFDERINSTLAKLARQYDLPLWNFWSSVQTLNNHGLINGSDMYLNREAKEFHRLDALETLHFVWRSLER